MTVIAIRRAEPGDAPQLVALGEAVALEAGGWMLTTETWRSAADERRYLKAVRSHADAAVFVAVDGGRRRRPAVASRATRTPRAPTSPTSA